MSRFCPPAVLVLISISMMSLRLLTDLHQIITRLDVVLVWLGVAPWRV